MSIVATNITKVFGKDKTVVLNNVSFRIEKGEFVALTGRSGSGKSTMLYIVSSLDNPTSGTIEIDGADVGRMRSGPLHRFRNLYVGFVFQFHYLLPELTALENVLMPALKAGQREKRIERAKWLLSQFGLEQKFNRLATQLSGGEQQRVAIARALIMEPRYLFADEPTGNLDSINGETVMGILQETNKKDKMTIVLVTHEPDFAARADRQIHLADGRIVNPSST